jgi:hypothetical protein
MSQLINAGQNEAIEINTQIINFNTMCRQPNTPMDYKHAELMRELNEFSIAIKVWLHSELLPDDQARKEMRERYARPDIDYIDSLHRRIREVLQKDATPFIKY